MNAQLNILLEDEYLLVVSKPAGVLSQPGKSVDGSIATQIRDSYPQASGPMLVHRLDMDTSGLMVFAKTKDVHRNLQQQFEHRTISKRYTALLSRTPDACGGSIQLPLRLDIDNRPTQIMCHLHGKSSTTLWRIAAGRCDRGNDSKRVYFSPITGRTHQLRVHAAHPLGLNAPIIGDRLYGTQGTRLMLHADRIGFWHPVSGQRLHVSSDVPF